MRHLISRHAATVAYAIGMAVILAAMLHVQLEQRSATRQACERGNLIRAQLTVQGGVLRSFLEIAANARDQSADDKEKQGDLRGARDDRSTARQYRALAPTLTIFSQVDCSRI